MRLVNVHALCACQQADETTAARRTDKLEAACRENPNIRDSYGIRCPKAMIRMVFGT